MSLSHSLQRLASISRKETLHIFRDRMALFMAFFFPVFELVMLGYAIDMNVRNVPAVFLDQARTQESAALLRQFENSTVVRFVGPVRDDQELHQAIVAGRARVAVKVPEDYSRRLQAGETAQVLVLVDGSLSTVAGEALNVGNAIALRESLTRALGSQPLPVEARPRVLFNPDMRSANFFIPGLMIVLCQMMAVAMSANAIVREKEKGTLEQLFMTPVRAWELILGKMAPYFVMTFVEFLGIAFMMRWGFGVPVHGQFVTLLLLTVPFVLTMLSLGLWISTKASTRDAAMQMAMATIMPSVFLSGYVFPLDSMPVPFWWIAQVIPTTWLIDASRGVILRGADWPELWPHLLVLWGMALAMIVLTSLKFRKQLT